MSEVTAGTSLGSRMYHAEFGKLAMGRTAHDLSMYDAARISEGRAFVAEQRLAEDARQIRAKTRARQRF